MKKKNPSQIVPVELAERRYEIVIEPGALSKFQLPEALHNRYSKAVIFSDTQVAKLYLPKVKRGLKKHVPEIFSAVCPVGEKSKSVEIANSLWQKMVGFGLDRESLVVALGGGVVGDLAGFVAATYMRGLDLLQLPTSLLAQVDSSVGGKVAVNLPQGKNLIGAFWQPRCVVIDPEVLTTLSEREFRAGLAEVVKYGMIMDAGFFRFLEENILSLATRHSVVCGAVIARCCELKAQVVASDERETTGVRAILNFGHTFAHGLENIAGYGKILHGEAVSIGMVCASRLAVQLNRCSAEEAQRLIDLLKILGLPTQFPTKVAAEVLEAMQRDKKKTQAVVNLVLPSKIGKVELVPWPGDEAVLQSMNAQ